MRDELRHVAPDFWSHETRNLAKEVLVNAYRKAICLAANLFQVVHPDAPTIGDRGPEDLLFQISCRPYWGDKADLLQSALRSEVDLLYSIQSTLVIYLEGHESTIGGRISEDQVRRRRFDPGFFREVHEFERGWFQTRDNCEVLSTDGLTPDQVLDRALRVIQELK